MEEKMIPELQTPPNVLTAHQSKRNLFIILGIAFVVVASIVSYASYVLSIQGEKDAIAKNVSLTPTVMPTPTPASPSASFVFYKDLSGEEKFSVANNFSDKILNAGFAYSPYYSMQSFKADETYKNSGIFFAGFGKSDTASAIASTIQCELANRKEPVGMCRESILGDVEVSIEVIRNKNTLLEKEKDPRCRKEIQTENRILISCEESMSPKPQDKGMRYYLSLLGENPVHFTVSSRTPKEYASLIRSIISSATNHL